MLRSMFSSVVGLRSMQTRMDVIGDNIANVNTPGFKASRVSFADLLSETVRGASGPGTESGGSNPMQIGLGTGLSSVDQIMTAGTLTMTGRNTDMAIEGEGLFVTAKGDQLFFSRAGNFNRDLQGYLVNPASGFRLQGWMAAADGTFGVKDQVNLTDIQINSSAVLLATATDLVTLGGTLNANATATAGNVVTSSISVLDSLGREHSLLLTFTRQFGGGGAPTNTWTWAVTSTDPDLSVPGGAVNNGTVAFNPDGSIASVTGGSLAALNADKQGRVQFSVVSANQLDVDLDFNLISQPALPGRTDSDLRILDRNGSTMGTLESFFLDNTGTAFGVYSNGQRRALAQVALATFPNPAGLLKVGANSFITSANSGLPQIGEPGTGGRGKISPSSLEASNVDLASEFTNMIITQRAYQANSRIITASDELLQDLVNIKR